MNESYSITKPQLDAIKARYPRAIQKHIFTVPMELLWDRITDSQRGAVAEYLIQHHPTLQRLIPNASLIEGKSLDGVVYPTDNFNQLGLIPHSGVVYECKTTRTKSQRVVFSDVNIRLLYKAHLGLLLCVFYRGPHDRALEIYLAPVKIVAAELGWYVEEPYESDYYHESLGEDDWLGPDARYNSLRSNKIYS